MTIKQFWVYLLLCENGHYYTGYTDNLDRRYQSHVNGTGKCKYTRAFKPVKIAQTWQVADKSSAMQLEYRIKQLSHAKKQSLITNPNLIS